MAGPVFFFPLFTHPETESQDVISTPVFYTVRFTAFTSFPSIRVP